LGFFSEFGDANRKIIHEAIVRGSYNVVCSHIEQHTGEKVAVKKTFNTFEHLSDAAWILCEIKLHRLLRYPDIVEMRQIMLPPLRRCFRDIYVIFHLMDADLHKVIKVNNEVTKQHHLFSLSDAMCIEIYPYQYATFLN
jgi:mitogen-activated protein kinase 1/3